MSHNRRQVKNPAALAIAAAATVGLTALAQAGLFGLSAAPLANGALPIGSAALEDALDRAPFVPIAEGEIEVWIISGIDCPSCRTVERRARAAAETSGYALNLLIAAPRGAPLEEAEAVGLAALARQGAGAWTDCVDASRGLTFVSDVKCRRHVSTDPAEIEGYVEWGRASYDRIERVLAVNGIALEPPAVIWRDEDGWRVSSGVGAALPPGGEPSSS